MQGCGIPQDCRLEESYCTLGKLETETMRTLHVKQRDRWRPFLLVHRRVEMTVTEPKKLLPGNPVTC